MRSITFVFDEDTNRFYTDTSDAGSTVDSGVTTLHVDPIEGCVMDLVFGVMLRSEGRLQGYPFSRLDEDGNAVLYSDVLTACTGGTLPVSLRLTYPDGSVRSSQQCILTVASIPDPSVLTIPSYKDVIMTRNSSYQWEERWTYPEGAIVLYNGILWVATKTSKGEAPGSGDSWANISVGQKPIETFDVFLPPASAWEDRRYIVEHVGFRAGLRVVVNWADEDYLDCWKSNVKLLEVRDGEGVFGCEDLPEKMLTLHLETYETRELDP